MTAGSQAVIDQDTATPEGQRYLLARVALVENRVRALVSHRRREDPAPDDPFRGLYVNDECIDRILAGSASGPPADLAGLAALERQALADEAAGAVIRLRRLAHDGMLSSLDVELLVVALLPDLDSRFERLYGYLNDDVTRRRATIGLALELVGASPLSAAARARLDRAGPLASLGLVLIEDTDRPFLTRGLRVPDRVAAHLLDANAPDPDLAPLLDDVAPYGVPLASDLARALQAGVRLVHLRERIPGTGAGVGVAALTEASREQVCLDLTRVGSVVDVVMLVEIAGREALLRGAGLVAGPVEALAEASPEALRRLTSWPVPVLLFGSATWDPKWTRETPLLVEAPPLGATDRVDLWKKHLTAHDPALDAGALAGHLALGPGQVQRAVRSAETSALLGNGLVGLDDLRRGGRAQNAAGLERLARRIEPEVGWDDLVLTAPVMRALREVTARARHRETVLTEWKMRRGGGRGRGVTALFAGDSGTGKTMSAEVIAADLGLDLYTVNLATVVDKYIGETEKNLERIFAEAGGVNAVLFFDEADAIFSKRSDVRDAHDRYANIESAYLLQRLETFDGLAVLATNLRANIDEAFTRRLDSIVDFVAPNEPLRLTLWQRCLAPPLPLAPDLDLGFCARSFELAGGNIRSAATTAAYLAADSGTPVDMAHVISAVEQEYRKLGRLVLEREFGAYLSLIP